MTYYKATKKDILRLFRKTHLPYIRLIYEKDGRVDALARREEWNNHVDSLASAGIITRWQADNWTNPF